MDYISWNDFESIDIRVGTVIHAEDFPEARKAAYKLIINFGDEIGKKKSSAQITENYDVKSLVGKQVVCVVNFPPKQIGPFMSEVLVTGFPDANGHIILTSVDESTPNGARLF